ncbi:hypothetical protein BJ170DRAFT_686160 [Xylariales sp. AK1849]|nr:hypothetical protein BJ170DRAFT_686160 [Xylariales sp. AK1849]
MADEDFEIDIYGSADNETSNHDTNAQAYDSNTAITVANGSNNSAHTQSGRQDDYNDAEGQDGHDEMDTAHGDKSRKTQQPQQGVKRKEGSDNRPIDPGATNCLMVSELNWWNTDDDVRKWVRQADSEEELKDITFSEHKVNGKSKGQAYVDFASQQAATATKHQIEASDAQSGGKKPTVTYSTPNNNPFRTLPKDAPTRGNKDQVTRGGSNTGGYNDRGGYNNNYRGSRGNFNNGPRGGFNRNFSGGNMGSSFNNNMGGGGGGFNPAMGGGFNGGFNNRGGGNMMGGGMRGGPGGGMRGGGRGGMSNMMGNMGNMGMPMGGMPGNMGMGMMGGGMPGFNGMQPHFNPGFFGGNQSGGNEWQNPHGAKRPRGE